MRAISVIEVRDALTSKFKMLALIFAYGDVCGSVD